MFRSARSHAAAFLGILFLAGTLSGCGGSGGVPPVRFPARVAKAPSGQYPALSLRHPALRLRHAIYARRIPHGAGLSVSPKALTLYGTGKASAAQVVVHEVGYRGVFRQSNTCAKVARIRPASGKGPTLTVKLTGVAVGACVVTFSDAKGHKALLKVTDKAAGGSLVTAFYVPLRGGFVKRHHGVHPKFISPSTQSMTFDITGPVNVSVVSGLTTTSPNCSLTLQGLDCAFNASLPAGSYEATITMYDAWDPVGNDIPVGAAPLSISQEPFTIANGSTNNVTFNFSGIPAQVTVAPATVLVAQSGNVYDLIGPGAHGFYAQSFDADNNLISGIGGPSYSVSTSGEIPVTLSTPPPGSPRFSVTPPSLLADAATLETLNVSAAYGNGQTDACTYPGAICQGSVSLDMQALLAVSSAYSIALFGAEKGTGPINTITSGLANGTSDIEFDPQGDLYAAVNSTGVNVYPLGSALPSLSIPIPNDIVSKMVIDAKGNLWVLDLSASKVLEYAPGATTPLQTMSVASSTLGSPYFLAVDANDDFWVGYVKFDNNSAVQPGGGVNYYAHGSSTPTTLAGLTAPVGMALDPVTNTLYVSDQTQYTYQHPYLCDFSAPCKLWAYTFGNWTSPTSIGSPASAGDIAVLDEQIPAEAGGATETIKSVFQDNADGTSFAIYSLTNPPPVTPDGFTANLNPATCQALVVDQRANMFCSSGFNDTVYEFRGAYIIGSGLTQNVAPFVTITKGLFEAGSLAIVP